MLSFCNKHMKYKISESIIAESVGDEVLICNSSAEKVLVLNPAATILWHTLVEHANDNADADLTELYISAFSSGISSIEEVNQDISEILSLLQSEEIINME